MSTSVIKKIVLLFLSGAFLSYSGFLYTVMPVKYKPSKQQEDSGKLIWQDYNCNACHQIYGLGGYLGPDLTNVYSKRGEEYIKTFLTTGTGAMPVFHLSQSESNSLLAFLKDIDASGKSDPRTFTLNYDGTIDQ